MGQPKDHDFQKSPPPTAGPSYGQPPPPPPPQYFSQPTTSPSYGQPPPPPPPQNYSQPPATGVPIQHGNLQGQWSTGICDCFDDVSNCCLTCWCPCITFGRIAEIVDKGSPSCGASGALYTLIAWATGCACIYSCLYREKMRRLYMLPGNKCTDCLLHSFCESCALCQEHRELQNRGFDMVLGWHGNAERQNHGVTMAPFVQGGMNR